MKRFFPAFLLTGVLLVAEGFPPRSVKGLRPKMVRDEAANAAGEGDGEDHVQAARFQDGSFIVAHSPFGHHLGVHMEKLSAKRIIARWYDPRLRTWPLIGPYTNTGAREFVPPWSGDQNHWVLEDADSNWP